MSDNRSVNPNLFSSFPDNDDEKEVYLQAAGKEYMPAVGERHVLLYWYNGSFARQDVRPIVQLTGIPGKYAYQTNVAKLQSQQTLAHNTHFNLGTMSRDNRDVVLDIADEVTDLFDLKSTVNGCRVWTRQILVRMQAQGLITLDTFNKLDRVVPLVEPQEEEAN